MLKSVSTLLLGLCLATNVQAACKASAQFLPGFNSDLSRCMKPATGTSLPHAQPFTISWDFGSDPDCATYANGFLDVPGLKGLYFGYAPCDGGPYTPFSPQAVTTVNGSLITTVGPCPACTSTLQQPMMDIYLGGNYNGTYYLVGATTVNLTYNDPGPSRSTVPTQAPVSPNPPKPATGMPTAIFPTTQPIASPIGAAPSLSRDFVYTLGLTHLIVLLLGGGNVY
ncbi:hypothetical protein K493DRAFT_318467 [Basidiobolus meristosporus CBS 931.73]|uniref:Uncharacterized protein n=1 Tax=Basidiobolus meristosporus CBS 931.73 TaxID=1314790 RepID=A0A1Y1XVJ1_9FUNG|nr:hypothetical protein K493DRAFT_318467 [Basidiobolus meristosporus CBS 931.73]|eukprot:ORX89769.1 hypothetical protein K493DRAFT_318467 [Basidiobolus meristosporus CBS 931.73]